MSKSNIKIIDKFKKIEKSHQKLTPFVVNQQYILYTYEEGEDEEIIFDDLISCLDRIPSKMKIIEYYQYSKKCYIIQLLSYYLDKDNNHVDVADFKLKFG